MTRDCFGLREVDVGQVFQNVGVIDSGAAVGDLDVAPAFERRKHHEQVGHAVSRVFVIDAGRKPWLHRHRRACGFGDELLGGLVQTNHRAVRVARPRVNRTARPPSPPTNAPLALGGMTQYLRRCGWSAFF